MHSRYARNVAAENLQAWLARRRFEGIDAVGHSHGGNVLLKSTEMGSVYGHVLLLSCPVRREYRLLEHAAITLRSLRIHFDLVILADRAGQRFPPSSSIADEYLPYWFYGHSKTTEPQTWKRHEVRV